MLNLEIYLFQKKINIKKYVSRVLIEPNFTRPGQAVKGEGVTYMKISNRCIGNGRNDFGI